MLSVIVVKSSVWTSPSVHYDGDFCKLVEMLVTKSPVQEYIYADDQTKSLCNKAS